MTASATTKLFTKVVLRHDVPAAALRAVLVPEGTAARAATSHHLVWTLFGDAPGRQRDFLWREHAPGQFYLLSNREPADRHGLFDVSPAKTFAPSFRIDDALAFDLRVNATVARGGAPGVRGKPSDIVMDAIYRVPSGERAAAREEAVDRVAREWMNRQGERAGFTVDALEVLGYSTPQLDRSRGRAGARFGVLDLCGQLRVRDAYLFVDALGRGFGRAKAFGCGMMLIRRV